MVYTGPMKKKAEAWIRCNRTHPKSPHARKERLREEAQERQEAHNKLTVQQKLDKAKARPGKSTKEVARLEKQLQD